MQIVFDKVKVPDKQSEDQNLNFFIQMTKPNKEPQTCFRKTF